MPLVLSFVERFSETGERNAESTFQNRSLMEGPKRPLQNKHFQTFIRPSHSTNICTPLMQKKK